MKIGEPENANMLLRGNGAEIADLKVVASKDDHGRLHMVSLWYPDERERLHLLAGLPVQVHVVTTGDIPAIGVDVSSHTNRVAEGIK